MTELETVLRSIDEDDCLHRSHYVVPWVARAVNRIAELESLLAIADGKTTAAAIRTNRHCIPGMGCRSFRGIGGLSELIAGVAPGPPS